MPPATGLPVLATDLPGMADMGRGDVLGARGVAAGSLRGWGVPMTDQKLQIQALRRQIGTEWYAFTKSQNRNSIFDNAGQPA